MEIVKKPEGRKTDVRWGRGIEGFLDSPEPPNRGGDISEDPPLPQRGISREQQKGRGYQLIVNGVSGEGGTKGT